VEGFVRADHREPAGGRSGEGADGAVAIVGAGALGTLLASLLPRGGAPVRILARRPERMAALRFEAPEATATADPSALFPASLVLVCVKAYHTEEAAALIAGPLARAPAPVASLQNGWGHMETLARALPKAPLLAGATTLGAYWDDGGRYHTSPGGSTVFAPWTHGAELAARDAVRRFRAAGLAAEAAPNGRDVLWRKLVLNVAVNPLTAIRGVPNGALRAMPDLWALTLAAAREAVAVGVARGHLAAPYDPEPLLERLLRDTASNRSSMAQDFARGRPTEADAILGALLREADAAGVPAPVAASLEVLLAELGASRRG
jgi:2-dehydropantoate 2-reductase